MAAKSTGGANCRQMVRAALFGRPSYSTTTGTQVHIWQRDGKYIARGRFQGRQFGLDLGKDPNKADSLLRQLMSDLESGAFVMPSQRKKRPFGGGLAPRLTFRELFDEFLDDTRRTRGKKTFQDYRSRLIHVLAFAEAPANRKQWPFAADIDRTFAVAFKAALHGNLVARNGHPLADHRVIAPGYIVNILGCLATALHWGKRPDVNRLPSHFANPFTHELVGKRPGKDPLRQQKLPMDLRIELVNQMDAWQLCTLALPFTLPNRPEDFAALLISEVEFSKRELVFGTRFQGNDFNKCKYSFRLALPPELEPILRYCIGSRQEGPLLLRRTAVDGRRPPSVSATDASQINQLFEKRIARAEPAEVQALADRKQMFRRVLRDLGGVTSDAMALEFKSVMANVRPYQPVRFYETRSAVTNDLKNAGVDAVFRHYVTAHSLGGEVLGSYESQDLHVHFAKYLDYIRPLLDAIAQRAVAVGITPAAAPAPAREQARLIA